MATPPNGRRRDPVGPREAARVVLVGWGTGLGVVSLAWTAAVGVRFASGLGERTLRLLELPALAFDPAVTAVVVGYLGLVAAVGLTAVGAVVPDRSTGGLFPDLAVSGPTRSRVVLDASLSALAAVGTVGVLVVLFPVGASWSNALVAAFLLRLVVLLECAVVLARLWRPLAAHSARLRSFDATYRRAHRRLEAIPRRRPTAALLVRHGAVVGTILGVPAVGAAAYAAGQSAAVVGSVVAVGVALGLPACAMAGVFPTAGTPTGDPDVRGQRTLVVGGTALAVLGTLVSAGAFLAATDSSALRFATVVPLPVTPADTLVVGWAMVLVGYAWRTRDWAGAVLGVDRSNRPPGPGRGPNQ